jgi:preprotein translocase subunit SecF
MEFLRDTNIDFMKYRKFWVVVSLALLAVGFFAIFVHGRLNIGIDFAGGTQITLKFHDKPDVVELRKLVEAKGVSDPQIQRFGEEADNSVIIKTRQIEGKAEGSRDLVLSAFDERYNPEKGGKPDVNRVDSETLAQILLRADPDKVAAQGAEGALTHYTGIAEKLIEERRKTSIFDSWDSLVGAGGLSQAGLNALRQNAYLGAFAVEGVENVGPQIGKELRNQGFWAVALSLVGMLIYVWLRFELRFGVGAVMACVHDVLVTLGLFALAGFEFNLTTVAAFLTLIGYSVNDTVVIFDRIRENMRKNRREPLIVTMNRSINETLSRTILTGGSTLLILMCLFIWGGDVIKGFAFVLLVGILAGTYSSIYVASPFALLWEQVFGARSKLRGTTGDAKPATSKAS